MDKPVWRYGERMNLKGVVNWKTVCRIDNYVGSLGRSWHSVKALEHGRGVSRSIINPLKAHHINIDCTIT